MPEAEVPLRISDEVGQQQFPAVPVPTRLLESNRGRAREERKLFQSQKRDGITLMLSRSMKW